MELYNLGLHKRIDGELILILDQAFFLALEELDRVLKKLFMECSNGSIEILFFSPKISLSPQKV